MAARTGASGYKLFVGNLPWTVGNKQLKEYFSQFGHIAKANVIFDKNTGMSKGFGFVIFSTEKVAGAASLKSDHKLEGYDLKIRRAEKFE